MKLSLGFLSSFLNDFLHAIAKQLSLTISTKPAQSFLSLIKAAKAQEAIQQSFQSSKGATDVFVYLLGDRNGQKVSLTVVSQSSWQKNPQVKSWTKYFQDAELFWGFSKNPQIAQINRSGTNPLFNLPVNLLTLPFTRLKMSLTFTNRANIQCKYQ